MTDRDMDRLAGKAQNRTPHFMKATPLNWVCAARGAMGKGMTHAEAFANWNRVLDRFNVATAERIAR